MDLFPIIFLLRFEDITDDDEDDLLQEVLSLYPLDQCVRTMEPFNHPKVETKMAEKEHVE